MLWGHCQKALLVVYAELKVLSGFKCLKTTVVTRSVMQTLLKKFGQVTMLLNS